MNVSIEEQMVLELMQKREALLAKKIQLLGEFRAYAMHKFRQSGKPFEIRYRSINGNRKIRYRDLKMGDRFVLKYGKFTFDPKTNMLSDCVETEIREIKRTTEFSDLEAISTSRPRIYRAKQKTLAIANRLQQQKIEIMMRKKVKHILDGIFKGELVFDDPTFKRLVATNIGLEQEWQALDKKMQELNIINSSLTANINYPYINNQDICEEQSISIKK